MHLIYNPFAVWTDRILRKVISGNTQAPDQLDHLLRSVGAERQVAKESCEIRPGNDHLWKRGREKPFQTHDEVVDLGRAYDESIRRRRPELPSL